MRLIMVGFGMFVFGFGFGSAWSGMGWAFDRFPLGLFFFSLVDRESKPLSPISHNPSYSDNLRTLPNAQDGDTIIVSQSTNALGATLAIQTLSTIPALSTGLAATTNTRLTTTALVPTTTALVPTTTAVVPTTTALGGVDTTTSLDLVETETEVVGVVPTTTRRTSTTRGTTTSLAIVA